MSAKPNPEAEIQALLSDLWQRHLPSMRERLLVLDQTAQSVTAGQLAEPQREEAQSIAHKLAGNLGMFGYQQAGSIASAIEHALKEHTPETLHQLPPLTQHLREVLAPYLI
jgi:HPt (histidine-containing phosphotransfer) domain-containing protein